MAGQQLHGLASPLGVLELTFLGLFLRRGKSVMHAGCLSYFYKYLYIVAVFLVKKADLFTSAAVLCFCAILKLGNIVHPVAIFWNPLLPSPPRSPSISFPSFQLVAESSL